jgi:hypothetical protein
MSSASVLAGLLWFLGPAVAAGKAGDPCDAPPAIRGALAETAVDDLALPERESEARELAALKRLVGKHPSEPQVWRRYLERRRQSGEDAAAISSELAERARRRPRDVVAAYAAALAAGKGDDQETARQLEALIERAPRLIEARRSLLALYRSGPARDEARLDQQIEALKKLCPASVRLARDLPRDGDLAAQARAVLRVQLESGVPADPESVRWLWSQASGRRRGGAGAQSEDRAALLEQMKKNLERWRSSKLATRPAFLPVMAYGYRLGKDSKGRRWVEDQILRQIPSSSEAARIALRRFAIEHPEPLPSDPQEAKASHAQALLEASAAWTRRWPGWPVAWERRLAALRRSSAGAETTIETARAALAALDQHPKALKMEPSLATRVAQLSRERGVAPTDVPGLAERAGNAVATAEPAKPESKTPGKAPSLRLTLDTQQFPDLAPWAAEAARVCQAWFPLIVDILSTDGFVPPAEVKMVYRAGMSVPGSASGRTLNLNGEHVRRNRNEVGMLIHELTHTVQAFGGPSWLTEGIADYIRWHVFEQPKLRMNPARASYEDGYRVTGAFLAWAANTYDRKLVRRLNAALRSNGFDEELFRVFTGKDLDTLWGEWLAAGAPAAMGPDAPGQPPATFVPPPITGT